MNFDLFSNSLVEKEIQNFLQIIKSVALHLQRENYSILLFIQQSKITSTKKAMISESLLRNFSHKKILSNAQAQNNKLKVYYVRASKILAYQVKSALDENKRQIIYSQKSQREKSKNGTINHQNMNSIIFQCMKQKKHSKELKSQNEKSKTPIHFIDLKFLSSRFEANEANNIERTSKTSLNSWRNLKLQSEGPKLKKENKTVLSQRKLERHATRKNTAQTYNTESKDERLLSPRVNDIQFIREENYCLQNHEILRCLSADSTYIIKRKLSIKNSIQRGEIFKKTIKRKFGKFSKKNY